MRNIRLVIAYDGTDFYGWQRQPRAPTIQGILEEQIARIVGDAVKLYGSGRTDAGVHAAGQVANFPTSCPIPCHNLRMALNNVLPATVRVRKVEEAHGSFHARYDAQSKTYRYRILQAPVCPPFLCRFVHHYPYTLDVGRMAKAARRLEGEHDFTSFAGIDPAAKRNSRAKREDSNVRRIFTSRLRRQKLLLVYEIRGSGFLHHMVRNIVGTLIEVGKGRLLPEDIVPILAARDRSRAGPTAPARGLSLVKVKY
jgi:tRNA pseudouridine38-40 synthase